MRPLVLTKSDGAAGAGRAAFRIARALRESGAEISMTVADITHTHSWIRGADTSYKKFISRVRSTAGMRLASLQRSGDYNLRSLNIIPSHVARDINSDNFDIVNIHWIGGEMASIGDVAKIKAPIVWTMHDMWAFCGAEHYSHDDCLSRWRVGYTKANRSPQSSGLDLDRFIWKQKRKLWKKKFTAICPSNWLADCARSSLIAADWNLEVIPNALDTSIFRPWPRSLARQMLQIETDCPLIAFGASSGTSDPRKGWDLLNDALGHVLESGFECEVVVFGGHGRESEDRHYLKTHYVGVLSDDISLALLYSAADIVVVPSRQDNLPQTATEAQSCGCPVVAFGVGGLRDIVEHGRSGYLAKPFDTKDLANCILGILKDDDLRRNMGTAARERAVNDWSNSVVAKKYLECFNRACER